MKRVNSKQYEAPTTEVFVMNLEVSILTASPAPTPGPAAGVTGSGFHFNETEGNW